MCFLVLSVEWLNFTVYHDMQSVCAMNVREISSAKKECKILSVFIGNQIFTGGSASMIFDITTY